MPAWLAAALALARSAGLGAAVVGGGLAVQETFGDGGFATAPLRPGGGFGPPQPRRRRRRRRALTASDRADIGFITGLLGPTAGKNFAITIATRASS